MPSDIMKYIFKNYWVETINLGSTCKIYRQYHKEMANLYAQCLVTDHKLYEEPYNPVDFYYGHTILIMYDTFICYVEEHTSWPYFQGFSILFDNRIFTRQFEEADYKINDETLDLLEHMMKNIVKTVVNKVLK